MSGQMQFDFVFKPQPLIKPEPITPTDRRGGLQAAFERFHKANPHVYDALRAVALWCKRNNKKMGMKAIYERVRWEYSVQTDGEPYKLNNNFTAFYARRLMEREPELKGFFETRKRRAL